MGLETNTNVQNLQDVLDTDGNLQPPASDAYDEAQGSLDLDAEGGSVFESLTAPGRPSQVTILAEFAGDGHIEMHVDVPDGGVIERTDAQNSDYGVTGGGQVFGEIAVPWRDIEIHLVDDTAAGTANQTEYAMVVV